MYEYIGTSYTWNMRASARTLVLGTDASPTPDPNAPYYGINASKIRNPTQFLIGGVYVIVVMIYFGAGALEPQERIWHSRVDRANALFADGHVSVITPKSGVTKTSEYQSVRQ
jgi:prepilin-type processing-associated H-X9-DG protein